MCRFYLAVFLLSPHTHSEFAADSRRVLDLPHALGEAFEADAVAVLHLVSHVRNDVFWREVASGEGGEIDHSSISQSMLSIVCHG